MIALSMPPVGLYPLAWVALVPLVVRWSIRKPSVDYARELYALLLTTSCCLGFWLLFNPNPRLAAVGGASLFLTPLPLTAAFMLAGLVRSRFGLGIGLAALVLNILAAELLTLNLGLSVPWLVLGHTQVEALDFIQIADLGGVLLLSLWVLLTNTTAFLAVVKTTPAFQMANTEASSRYGERGAYAGVFAALIVLPVVYGSVRTAQSDVPSGYTRVGIVQPGVPPGEWDRQDAQARVKDLAGLSDDLLGQWASSASDPTGGLTTPPHTSTIGLLIWPQSSLPHMPTQREESRLYQRLADWSARRGVSLLAGAILEGAAGHDPESASEAAVLFRPNRAALRYTPMRRIAVMDPASRTGNERVLLDAAGVEVATTVGFESVFGDHLRRFTKSGANLIVVLSRNDLWGRSSGLSQHMMFTRLRAIESRRTVVVSTVSGVSAMILPNGRIERATQWRDEGAVAIQAPTFRHETFYVRHGDWVGVGALILAILVNGGALVLASLYPGLVPRPRRGVPPKAVYG